jgi:hypothetical protein
MSSSIKNRILGALRPLMAYIPEVADPEKRVKAVLPDSYQRQNNLDRYRPFGLPGLLADPSVRNSQDERRRPIILEQNDPCF